MTHAQLQLDVVALRHVPNLLVERLLDDAEAGYPRMRADGLEALLSRFGTDLVHLDDLIERTEAVVKAVGVGAVPGATGPHGRN